MTTAIVIAATLILIAGLFAVIVERTNERDEARTERDKAKAQAEKFADEYAACHAANEVLTVELACADGTIHHLQNDLIAAHKRLSDYENGAEVIAFPIQRDPQHDSLAALDAEATEYTWPAIAREAFPIQQWGEEAEK